jgi:hypothetical protein
MGDIVPGFILESIIPIAYPCGRSCTGILTETVATIGYNPLDVVIPVG